MPSKYARRPSRSLAISNCPIMVSTPASPARAITWSSAPRSVLCGSCRVSRSSTAGRNISRKAPSIATRPAPLPMTRSCAINRCATTSTMPPSPRRCASSSSSCRSRSARVIASSLRAAVRCASRPADDVVGIASTAVGCSRVTSTLQERSKSWDDDSSPTAPTWVGVSPITGCVANRASATASRCSTSRRASVSSSPGAAPSRTVIVPISIAMMRCRSRSNRTSRKDNGVGSPSSSMSPSSMRHTSAPSRERAVSCRSAVRTSTNAASFAASVAASAYGGAGVAASTPSRSTSVANAGSIIAETLAATRGTPLSGVLVAAA